jgi:multiple sugar transport system substrate-binding protein
MGWEASPLETDAVRAGIAAFEEQFPHISVEYTPVGGADYGARLLAAAAGGAMPDVFFLGSGDYRAFAARGVILDITDKFDEEFALEDFLTSSRALMQIDGRVYGIQSCIVTPVLYFNMDIFDNAGVPHPGIEPMQWEEFREKAIALTTDDIFGVFGIENVWETMHAFLFSNGASMFSDDMSRATINSPQAREVFNAIRDLRIVDQAAADAVTLENIGMNAAQMLQTGRVAMVVDGSWALQELAQMDFRLGVAPIPYFNTPVNVAQAHLHSIDANTSHQGEAWEFLKFLSGMYYQGRLVNSGLWMPNRNTMFLPEYVDQWYDEDIHGNYIYFLDYFMNALPAPSAKHRSPMKGTIIIEETDIFYRDIGDIDVMIENIERRINDEIARVEAEGL